MRPGRLLALVLLTVAAVPLVSLAGAASLVVEAGDKERLLVPMCVEVPAAARTARMTCQGREVPCQVADGRLWWILDRLPERATRTYRVELGARPRAQEPGVVIDKGEKSLGISIGGKPFTIYHFVPGAPAGVRLHRPCFFPVYGPDMVTMTRPYPLTKDVPANVSKDHPHHTSIWVAHGAVNGVDNWAVGRGKGFQVHKTFDLVASGPVVGIFRERLEWTAADGKRPLVSEVRTVRVYNLPESHRMLDLEVTFIADHGAVVFGDTKEGGICATRMRPEFRHDRGGRLVNSAGQTGRAAWGKKALWVDASGKVGGKRYGYAIFDAPTNLRHPTTWHARTYGLLTANPFGLSYFTGDRRNRHKGDYRLEAGGRLTFRYRIYFHRGDEQEGGVAARYDDFASPPKATWR